MKPTHPGFRYDEASHQHLPADPPPEPQTEPAPAPEPAQE